MINEYQADLMKSISGIPLGILGGAMSGAAAGVPGMIIGAVGGLADPVMNLVSTIKDHKDAMKIAAESIRQPVNNGYAPFGYNTGYYALGGVIGPAAYKAEDGEVIYHDQRDMPIPVNGNVNRLASTVSKLKGNKHEQGGIDVTGGEAIYSNRIKTESGKTFAQEAERLGKKLKKAEQLLQYPKFTTQYRTGMILKKMIEKKLQELFAKQQQFMQQNQ